MSEMRAQLTLRVRANLDRLRRFRTGMTDAQREVRRLRSDMNAARGAAGAYAGSQDRMRSSTDRTTDAIRRQGQALDRLARKARQDLTAGLTRGGLIAAGGAGAMYAGVRATRAALRPGALYGDFDAQADAVAAIAKVRSGSAEDLALRRNARDLGASTSFSAMEAAQGQEFLAAAGFDVAAITASMGSVLNLAKAGRVDMGLAADIASNIGSSFGIEKSEAGMDRLADVMIATRSNSNVDVPGLGETMKYSGAMARNLGVSLETTAALSGVLGDFGVQGSEAGTAMRAIMGRLASGEGAAGEALESLGIRTKDAAGDLRPIVDLLDELQDKTADLGSAERTEVLNKIAGMEAGGALAILTGGEGLDRVRELIGILEGAEGEAKRVSEAMGDNLPGDLKEAMSALQELGLVVGEEVAPVLRDLVQGATEVIRSVTDWADAHPRLTKTLGLGAIAAGGLATAAGALAIGLGGAIATTAVLRFGLRMLGLRAARSRGGLLDLAGAVTGLGRRRPDFRPAASAVSGFRSSAAADMTALASHVDRKVGAMERSAARLRGKAFLGAIGAAIAISAIPDDPAELQSFMDKGGRDLEGMFENTPGLSHLMEGYNSLYEAIRGEPPPRLQDRGPVGPTPNPHPDIHVPEGPAPLTSIPPVLRRNRREGAEAMAIRDQLVEARIGGPLPDAATLSALADHADYARERIAELRDQIDELGDGPMTDALAMPYREELRGLEAELGPTVATLEDARQRAEALRSAMGALDMSGPITTESVDAAIAAAEARAARLRGLGASTPAPEVSLPPMPRPADFAPLKAELDSARSEIDALPPAVRTATSQGETVLASTDWTLHGQRMMETVARGVTNSGHLVAAAVSAELAEARALLPSSNAKRGPLSNLTGNGAAILATMAEGVRRSGAPLMAALAGEVATLPPIAPRLAAAAVPIAPGQASGQGGMTVQGGITINVHGAGDPEAVARAVQRQIERMMHGRMSD